MTGKRFWLPVAGIWAFTAILLVVIAWSAITTWRFPDPDDQMRLLEVRDWIVGQSWFDVAQYRLNPPEGVPMHWSRLIDLPIASVILLTMPLLGQALAEHVALVVVPMITLGVVMALLAAIARRLLGPERAILAVCLVPLCVEVTHQLRPMRIDHHGWQMALALAAALALLGSEKRRAGLLAGGAVAVWLAISLEGLPMVAALLAFVALRWVAKPDDAPLFRATALSTAIVSLLLFAATHPARAWGVSPCDAISPVYLAMLGIAAIGSTALTLLPLRSPIARITGLAVVGLATLAPIPLIAPACAAGPFAQLDPLVRDFWYMRVSEGLPIWEQTRPAIINSIALPLIGLAGIILAIRTTEGEDRSRWIALLALAGAATAAAILVQRSSGFANLLAIPGVVRIVHPLLLRARAIANVPARIGATLGVFILASPGVATSLTIEPRVEVARRAEVRKAMGCLSGNDMAALRVLPPSAILAPLDMAPSILLLTQHSAVASGHHRGYAAMHDVVAAFTGSDAVARDVAARHRIDYVAFCPGIAEALTAEEVAPAGLLARLDRGATPDWLEPVAIGGSPVKVWRVRRPAQ